jgi:1-acyl-sn-glycerol-3-phosphate acyltransferase
MSTRDRFDSPSAAAVRYVAQRGLLKSIVWTTTRVTVRGREHVDDLDAPFIVVANHSSHLDTPLIQGALPSRLSTKLAAGAATDYFFDVRWRRIVTGILFNTYPVDRGPSRGQGGMSKSLLSRDIPLLIFPEGSRSHDGEMSAFKPGAAALSISCGVPILPVGLIGTHDAMPRGRSWPVPGRTPVTAVFGAPMSGEDGESAETFMTRVQDAVRRLRGGDEKSPDTMDESRDAMADDAADRRGGRAGRDDR